MIRSLLRLAAVAALLLLLASPAFAQGQLFLTDPGGQLDRAAVQRAAQPLIDRGAQVAVYFVQSGGDSDFVSRLTEDGLVRDGLARTKMIAIYVALNDRYSGIRYGDDWNVALQVNDNFDLIRTQELNPGLSSGDYTGGVTSTLGAIEQAIVSPPSPNGSVNVNTAPLAAGGLAAATAIAGGALYASRRRAAKIKAEADRQLKEAKEGAATLIADLGQRFRNAEEKAQYDRVSYAPPDVERLRVAQSAAQARFVKVQTDFDDVGEQLDRYAKPEIAQLNASAAAYSQVSAAAQVVVGDLSAVEQIRAELDALARQAPEEIARAKKS
ncbi:hypothetical protein K2Z83_01150 [Oscillochloris sp. ZM17-4]|uniref:hypothetical protein n=1 Tax=Oscillochloris sp. ZM17-4 TaxID=2866714 RepID=UPI001C734CD0|nr:hypothetical protein [Oscillochloris sp. ZM17-4]MBX0326300.1 hypothetical protein [Oscillochloris sp. ZM17-4]